MFLKKFLLSISVSHTVPKLFCKSLPPASIFSESDEAVEVGSDEVVIEREFISSPAPKKTRVFWEIKLKSNPNMVRFVIYFRPTIFWPFSRKCTLVKEAIQ